MSKTIIYYYSKTGNNKYLANKTAKLGKFDIEELRPKYSSYFMLILSQMTTINFGIKNLENKPSNYENIILCGPLWMGRFAPPITAFLKKYNKSSKNVHLITCCGSSDEKKNDNFGYELVFTKLKKKSKANIKNMTAFPITLILSKEEQKDGDAMMKARLKDENFKGVIKKRLEGFVNKI